MLHESVANQVAMTDNLCKLCFFDFQSNGGDVTVSSDVVTTNYGVVVVSGREINENIQEKELHNMTLL